MNIIREWFDRHFSNRQVVILAVVLALGFTLVLYFGDVLGPALIAMVLAYLMEGLVVKLTRLGVRRGFAVGGVYSLFLFAFVWLLIGLMPRLFHQVERFVQDVPRNVEVVRGKIGELKETHPQWFIPADAARGGPSNTRDRNGNSTSGRKELVLGNAEGEGSVVVLTPQGAQELAVSLAPAVVQELHRTHPGLFTVEAPETEPDEEEDVPGFVARTEETILPDDPLPTGFISERLIDDALRDLGTKMGQYTGNIVTISLVAGSGLVQFMVYALLVLLMVFFFLKDKERILRWFSQFVPRDSGLVTQVWRDVDMQIGNYVRGKFLEIMIVWVITWITFMILDLDYAMLLALGVGLSVLVPYIGATMMTIPVALVAFFQFGTEPEWYWTVGAYLVIQLLDGNVLAPLLFSEVTNLHPVAIIVAVIFFGGLWGFWGVFFAIPLATLVQAVLRAWPRLEVLEEAAGPDPASG